MKATIIDTIHYHENKIFFSHLLEESFKNKNVSSDVVKTADMNLIPCMGCDGCLYKTQGRCVMKDNTSDVLTPISKNEILICLTELRFGGYSSDFKLIVDKFTLLATPYYQMAKEKLVHRKRYPNPEKFYILGFSDHVNSEQAENFSRIVHHNAINLNINIYGSFVFEKKAFNNETSAKVVESVLKGEIR